MLTLLRPALISETTNGRSGGYWLPIIGVMDAAWISILLPLEIAKVMIIASIIWMYAVIFIKMVTAVAEVIFTKE